MTAVLVIASVLAVLVIAYVGTGRLDEYEASLEEKS